MHVHAHQRLWAPTRIHIGPESMLGMEWACSLESTTTSDGQDPKVGARVWTNMAAASLLLLLLPPPPLPPPQSRSRLSNLLLDDRFTSAVTAVTQRRPGAREGEMLRNTSRVLVPFLPLASCPCVARVLSLDLPIPQEPRAARAASLACRLPFNQFVILTSAVIPRDAEGAASFTWRH